MPSPIEEAVGRFRKKYEVNLSSPLGIGQVARWMDDFEAFFRTELAQAEKRAYEAGLRKASEECLEAVQDLLPVELIGISKDTGQTFDVCLEAVRSIHERYAK